MLSSYDKSRAAKLAELFTAQELDFITDALDTTEGPPWLRRPADIIWEAFNIAASRAYA